MNTTDAKHSYGLPDTGFIRAKDLIPLLPFSKSTLWAYSASGAFPRPYKLSEGVTVWKCEDVSQWLDSKTQYPTAKEGGTQ